MIVVVCRRDEGYPIFFFGRYPWISVDALQRERMGYALTETYGYSLSFFFLCNLHVFNADSNNCYYYHYCTVHFSIEWIMDLLYVAYYVEMKLSIMQVIGTRGLGANSCVSGRP